MTDDSWLFVSTAILLGVAALLFSIRQWGLRTPLLALVFLTYLTPQTQFIPPFDTRLLGVVGILTLVVHTLLSPTKKALRASPTTLIPLLFILLSALWSTGASGDTLAQSAFLLAMIALVAVPFTENEYRQAMLVTLTVLAVVTLIVAAQAPDALREAGRLRGPMANANSLALICVFAFPSLRESHRLALAPAAILTLVTVAATGSRAAIAAVSVQVLISIIGAFRTFGRIASITLMALAALYALPTVSAMSANQGAGSESVLRSNNSRQDVWTASWARAQETPWVGSGLGTLTSEFESGSSLFSVWIIGGIVAVVLVLYSVASTLAKGAVRLQLWNWSLLILVGGAVNAIFEGWLLAAGTAYALWFWLALEQTQKALYQQRVAKSRTLSRHVGGTSPGPRTRESRNATKIAIRARREF